MAGDGRLTWLSTRAGRLRCQASALRLRLPYTLLVVILVMNVPLLGSGHIRAHRGRHHFRCHPAVPDGWTSYRLF
jgi:hypothetical protein